MTKLKVAFFWHMHQPYYKDPFENKYLLPWVRLHSVKAYYDMPLLLEKCPGMKLTFNIVPSLARQIRDYVFNGARDIYFDLSEKDPDKLNDDEKVFLIKNFFMCHWGNMIYPYKRYSYLLNKRGIENTSDDELRRKIKLFTRQEFFDLQVWFNLTWFGFYAEKRHPFITELRKKDQGFSQEEKDRVLSTHISIMGQVLDIYRRFQDEGSAELTTSPYYHPILPLVFDNRLALRCMPQLPLNNVFSSHDDAHAQIVEGVKYHTKVFGKPPKGLWPSEGSVAPEIIPSLKEAGIEWIATDEEILYKSMGDDSRGALLQGYSSSHAQDSIKIVFRDRELSDLIGFTYSRNNAQKSVDDFMSRLHAIRHEAIKSNDDPAVFVILDGENAWEHYVDGGEEFLTSLYNSISNDPDLEPVTVSEYLEGKEDLQHLDNLYTGSWIFSNFQIWIGSEEDRSGWDYLGRTRTFLEEFLAENSVSEEKRREIYKFIYRAEGSDWFWWYADEFSSENKQEFDLLFRKNLMMVFTLLGQEIPDFLKTPIVKKVEGFTVNPPKQLITPVIDGEVTDYFEWFGAGTCETYCKIESMHQKRTFLKSFEYGYNNDAVFFKLEYEDEIKNLLLEKKEYKYLLKITIDNARKHLLKTTLQKGKKALFSREEDGSELEVGVIATGSVTEVELSFEKLNIEKNGIVYLSVELWNDKLMLCQFPALDRISIQTPDEHYNQKV